MSFIAGSTCYICGCVLKPPSVEGFTDDTFTLDHLQAKARGGETTAENVVPCCRRCNLLKGSNPLTDELRAILKAIRRTDKAWRVRRVDVNDAKDTYDIYLSKRVFLHIRFFKMRFEIVELPNASALPKKFVKNICDGLISAGYRMGSATNKPVSGKCNICGRKMTGTVEGGVIICNNCIAHIRDAADLVVKLADSYKKLKFK